MQVFRTKTYARSMRKLLADDEVERIENDIADDPFAWPVVPGTGGVRKARARRPGTGKSGGLRVIYYYVAEPRSLYFIVAYAKSRQTDLTTHDREAIRRFLAELRGPDA